MSRRSRPRRTECWRGPTAAGFQCSPRLRAGPASRRTARRRPARRRRLSAARPKTGIRRPGNRGRTGAAARASEFAARLDRFGLREGLFAAEEPAALSDGAVWIWNVGEEIFAVRDSTFILDRLHALEYAAAAVRAVAPDTNQRKTRLERVKAQPDDGRDAAGRKRAPTLCSPPNAASKTTDGPTSSTGGPVASQPPDPEI